MKAYLNLIFLFLYFEGEAQCYIINIIVTHVLKKSGGRSMLSFSILLNFVEIPGNLLNLISDSTGKTCCLKNASFCFRNMGKREFKSNFSLNLCL